MTADILSPLVPKLRFPEFQDAPGWSRRLMGRYLSESRIKGSGGHKAKKLTVKLWGKGVFEKHESVQGSANTQYYRRRAGQFVYSKLDFLNQAFGIIPEHLDGFESTVDLPCFDIDPELNATFLLEYVQREHFYKTRGEIADGGRKAKRIQVETFLECPIYSPSKPEQQKIADCLGSLDDLIAAEGRKLEALREHKQGLMQQLFPQTGQSRPRLRFPEFRNAVEWQGSALGEIAEISKGKGISKSDVVQGGLTPCVRYGELYTSYGEIIEIVESRTNLPASDLVLSNAGDVIIPASGETKEDIATCACVVDDGVALGSDLNVIRSPVDGRFFSYYLNGSRRRELSKVAQGDTVAHLYPTQLSRLEVYIPGAKAEQQRIADCLSTLDARLAAQVQKLNVLKTHKQGLLQQLFPSLEAESR